MDLLDSGVLDSFVQSPTQTPPFEAGNERLTMFRSRRNLLSLLCSLGRDEGIWMSFLMCFSLSLILQPGLPAFAKDWRDQIELGGFRIKADFALNAESALLSEIEQLTKDVSQTLGIEVQSEGTEILLFGNRRDYQDYLSVRVPEGVHRPALFVKSETMSRVYAYRCPELATNLRHETTHALLHASLQIIPLWLDEGLAEYFEVPRDERVHGSPHLTSLQRWNSRFTWRLHLEGLAEKEEMSQMSSRDYRDAFSVVHFLIHGPPEAQRLLHNYLTDIQGGDVPPPLTEQISKSFPRPEVAIVEHIRSW